jgi:N-acetyl-anhydromuramyl-L-alanine amidase AmpD
MKQSAVEWLVQELNLYTYLSQINQAKEKEKEKIIDAYNQGCLDTLKDGMKRGEQYYNETFNK